MYLLDTHIWLWATSDPSRIAGDVINILSDLNTNIFFSPVVAWEITIKYETGKLKLPEPPALYIPGRIQELRMTELSITSSHAILCAMLPKHHRDPFDRLLIAQAIHEDLTLVTADDQMLKYDVRILDARG